MIYGYIRVSTDTQDVEAQKIGINEKAKSLGYTIERWIEDEGISGTTEFQKRKLGKLMKMLNKEDVIIASEISRFARKLFLLFEFLSFVTKKEVQLWTVKDNFHLDGTLQSTILAFAFGMAAQIERDMISQRTKEGLRRRREEGVLLGRPMGSKSIYHKTDKKKTEIEKYIAKGISYSAISRLTGLHRLTIAEYCKNNGLSAPSEKAAKNGKRIREQMQLTKSIKLKAENIDAQTLIKAFVENHYSVVKMAEAFVISYSTAISWIKTFNLRDKFYELQEEARLKNPSLSAQGKILGISDTRDVRRYLKSQKTEINNQ
jgi:DNA invertase Pin-like site-specific DNA recombinase